jgi:hypothetical protein
MARTIVVSDCNDTLVPGAERLCGETIYYMGQLISHPDVDMFGVTGSSQGIISEIKFPLIEKLKSPDCPENLLPFNDFVQYLQHGEYASDMFGRIIVNPEEIVSFILGIGKEDAKEKVQDFMDYSRYVRIGLEDLLEGGSLEFVLQDNKIWEDKDHIKTTFQSSFETTSKFYSHAAEEMGYTLNPEIAKKKWGDVLFNPGYSEIFHSSLKEQVPEDVYPEILERAEKLIKDNAEPVRRKIIKELKRLGVSEEYQVKGYTTAIDMIPKCLSKGNAVRFEMDRRKKKGLEYDMGVVLGDSGSDLEMFEALREILGEDNAYLIIPKGSRLYNEGITEKYRNVIVADDIGAPVLEEAYSLATGMRMELAQALSN